MTFPTQSSASGIWNLKEVRNAIMGNDWPLQELQVEYLVIAGGGGGGAQSGGGGGAGGYRTNYISGPSVNSPKLSGANSAIESAFIVSFGTAYTVAPLPPAPSVTV